MPSEIVKTALTEIAFDDVAVLEGTDDWVVPPHVKENPLFVEVGNGTITLALQELDRRMRKLKIHGLISRKTPHSIFGFKVRTGDLGLWVYAGRPEISLRPGQYWNLSPRYEFKGTMPMNANRTFNGLTICQVGQGIFGV